MNQRFIDPAEVLKQLKLKEGMIAADFGCGSGGWVIPLAKKLEEGTVYAIDILEEPLSALKGRAQIEKISNIRTIKSDIEKENGSTLNSNFLDLVLMTNLLFECEDKKLVLEEGKRVLKKGGKILVVDWTSPTHRPKAAHLGPEKTVSAEEVKELARELNLKLEEEFEAGTYHYALVFTK